MLGRLASKFKRQTLQDGNGGGAISPPGQMSPPPTGREIGASGTRRSARLNEKAEKEKGGGNIGGGGIGGTMPLGTSPSSPSPPNTRARRAQLEAVAGEQKAKQANQILMSSTTTGGGGSGGPMLCDSGTESDDDELEKLDSLSNASRAALEDGIRRSPPTLTSSPPLISEIETSSKDAFPAHFRTNGGIPMPIDFSALRHSELNGGLLLDDAPTPIGSQKGPGQGAVLMEIAHQQMENNKTTSVPTQPEHQNQHQGAFRRVLRRTRRNSNSQNQQPVATIAARTVSPVGIGLGEKRRWDAPINGEEQQQLATTTQTTTTIQPELEAMPIAARTRGSLLMGMLDAGQQQQSMDGDASRPVLTAARRTRVRVLYSQDHGKGGTGGFPMSMVVQSCRGQVAPMLGHSPPNMLVANKRGRHCSKSSNSPSRPSLNFDKMRKRMLNGGNGNGGGNGTTEDGTMAELD